MIASAGAAVENLGPWDGGLRFRYFGRRPLIEDNSVTLGPDGAVRCCRSAIALTECGTLRLDVFNLFNSQAHQIDYFYPSQLANEAAPVYDIHFKPVEPLSARLTLAVSF